MKGIANNRRRRRKEGRKFKITELGMMTIPSEAGRFRSSRPSLNSELKANLGTNVERHSGEILDNIT